MTDYHLSTIEVCFILTFYSHVIEKEPIIKYVQLLILLREDMVVIDVNLCQ